MIKTNLGTKFCSRSTTGYCERDCMQSEPTTSDESDDLISQCNGLREVGTSDINELLFIIPDHVQVPEWKPAGRVQSSRVTKAVATTTRGVTRTTITTLDRLMWSQGIWCLPNLSRKEAENLLKGAEPGNFILRVNRTNCAMVLSRRVPDATAHIAGSVQHNTIEVIPRSGYCLTSDKSTQLIFDSLVQLLHFYLRISRERSTVNGAFLQLPKAIVEAPTLEALEQLNQLGKGFWCTASHKPAEHKTHHVSRRSPRTASADRWAGTLDTSSANTPLNVTRLRSRARDPQPPTETHINFRGRASSLGGSSGDRERGSSPERITNGDSHSRLAHTGHQGFSSTPKSHPEVKGKLGDRLTNQRTRACQNGVYEHQEGDFWRSVTSAPNMEPKSMSRQNGEYVDRGHNSINPIGPSSKHLYLPHYDREEEEERCKLWPTPPPYSPSGLTVTSFRNTDIHPTVHNACDVNRGVSGRENTKRPIMATLDEHLKSLEKQEQKDNIVQDRNTLRLHYEKIMNHQVPCWHKTAHDKRFFEQHDQINGELKRQEPSNSSTTGTSKCAENDKAVAINDSTNTVDYDRKTSGHPAIQLPSPKTVGKVFVMEAATYCNDDYELLSESVSGRRLYVSSQNSGAKDWPVEREVNRSGCSSGPNFTSSCKLRRAHTTRDSSQKLLPERVVAQRTNEDAKRRYAVFLDGTNEWRKSSEETGPCVPTLADNFTTVPKPLNNSWQMNSISPVSTKELTPVEGSSASQPSGLAGTRAYVQNGVGFETQQTPWCSDRSDEVDGEVFGIENKLKPFIGSAPPSSSEHSFPLVNSPTATEPPVPRSRRTLASASTRSTQSEKQDNYADPSPSNSSRASTVFCAPWDAAPTGVYLSDLIQLAGGGVTSANRRDPPSHFRRRTLSSLDQRIFNERPVSAGEPCQHNSRTEFQRLLWLWMQHNSATDDKSTVTKPHSQSGTDDLTASGPPPVPRRRPRLKHIRANLSTTNATTNRSVRSDESTEINPYAVVTCSTDATSDNRSSTESRGAITARLSQDVAALKPDESFSVYDDTFVENTNEPTGEMDLAKHDTELSNKCDAFPNDSNASASRARNYVYAQVLPRNLRRQPYPSSSPSSMKSATGPATDSLAVPRCEPVVYSKTVTKNGFVSSPCHSDSSSNELFTPSDYSPLPAAVCNQDRRNASCYRARPLSTSYSLSSLSSRSRSPSPTVTYSTQWPQFSPISVRDFRHKVTETKNHQTPSSGHYIRRFVNRLMRDKSSPVAKQINLFLDCTRNSVSQGPYRTMQSVRQFISGITNHLLQNPKLGLPSVIELEKRQLSDYGFVNVGALLESSLQKYVLRPLHRHIIRQLKQEQIKHNELGPLQNTTQLISSLSPPEFGIPSNLQVPTEPVLQRVRELFRQVQSTYSVSRKIVHLVELFSLIRKEVGACDDHTHQLSPEDLRLVYVWTFAHAGLLLASFPKTSVDSLCEPQVTSSIGMFCPAAVQADYLDGLLTKTQLQNQAVGQCCLNDLFATLYVTWTWSSTRYNSSPELLTGIPYPTSSECCGSHHAEGRSVGVDCDESTGSHNKTKRRILPPRRRKTITSPTARKELQSQSPLSGTKWHAQPSSGSIFFSGTPKEDLEEHKPSSLTRWRPWVPNPFSSKYNPGFEQPMLRVLAVDERAGQLRSHLYPARPSLTAAELCNLLSFEMKVFDPKEYGLFAYVDGKEILLADHIHLIDFLETSKCGSKQTLISHPSPTVFAAKLTHHTLRPTKKSVQRSLSSRSNSPPSSGSLESYPRTLKKPERSNSFSVVRWLMRKRSEVDAGGLAVTPSEMRLVGSQLETTISTDVLRLFPLALHHTMGRGTVLIYKRISGVFAISERAFDNHCDTPQS